MQDSKSFHERSASRGIRDFFNTPQRRPRRAAAVYVLVVLVAWLLAWALRGNAGGAASLILVVPLFPSVLLAIPFAPTSVLENSFDASAVLIGTGCLNTVLVYFAAKFRSDRSVKNVSDQEGHPSLT